MTDFVEELKQNHTLHGALIGGGVYYLMNKNESKDALKYGVVIGGLSAWYMGKWGHTTDGFDVGKNMFAGFNKEFAELTGT